MLTTLRTLKARPLAEQAGVIERLAKENWLLYDALKGTLPHPSETSAFQLTFSSNKERVVRVALLAVVAADIAGVPHARGRAAYQSRLEALCQHIDIDYNDVLTMVAHVRAIEHILQYRDV